MLFALSIAAMATQAGSAPLPPRLAQPSAHWTAPAVSLPRGLELPALVESLLHGPPASGSWALLLAGLTGVLAIAHRRMSALGSLNFDPRRLRRR